MNDVNIVETLNAIIRLQSTIIDELFAKEFRSRDLLLQTGTSDSISAI